MFQNLMKFWQGRDFLTEIYKEFGDMLKDTKEMFSMVCGKLMEGKVDLKLKETIYLIDKSVNELERKIRMRIIEHLSVQPSTDVPFCLVLMSVVKDAERLGDYAKNLFQVTEMLHKPLNKKLYHQYFNNMDRSILELFDKTKTAFIKSDEKKATEITDLERKIVRTCDQILINLSKSDLTVNEAVCMTLIARYFKRTAAHLTNIGTSVILPIDKLDFFDEKLRHARE
ncbi:MAG: PhoU domain-containing protein [bacterium]